MSLNGIVVAALLVAQPSDYVPERLWSACASGGPLFRIAACTEIVNDRETADRRTRAAALVSRALARMALADWDNALRDADRAVLIDDRYALA